MKIQREELNGMSAFDYCRQVIGSCPNPDESLEVYRGDTLSYTVKSIKQGAETILVEEDKRGFRFKKYKPMSERNKEILRDRRKRIKL